MTETDKTVAEVLANTEGITVEKALARIARVKANDTANPRNLS